MLCLPQKGYGAVVKSTETSNMKSFHRRHNQSENSSLQERDAEGGMIQVYKNVGIEKVNK